MMANSAVVHPSFDDPARFVFYRYYPSLPAAVIFVALFFATTVWHMVQTKRAKTWYFIPLIVGGVFEFVGYIGRILSTQDQWSLGYYIIQATLLLVAPALFAASIYMTLGRIILLVDGEKHSLIPKRWLTKVFVIGDILSFVTQGSGAGIMAGGSQAKFEAGEHIVVGGLVLQIVSFSFFIVVAFLFHHRILRNPTAESSPESGIKWQKHLYVLYTASSFILIRSVFRVIEYSMGNNSYLLKHEVFLYIFDSVLMLATLVLLNIIHPGEITRSMRKTEVPEVELQYSEESDNAKLTK